MPSIKIRQGQPTPVPPQVDLLPDFPAVPQAIVDRFPDAALWQQKLDEFWERTQQAIQLAQQQVASFTNSRVTFSVDTFQVFTNANQAQAIFALDGTGIRLGHVLVVDTPGRTLHVGVGQYQNANTPIYMDIDGKFSLADVFAFDPGAASPGIVIAITGGSINDTPIGNTTPSSGEFTTLTAHDLLDISAATAGQIKFPATQNPSSNVNTLDDYEEGTWTPSIGGNATYTLREGHYTKIGRQVTLYGRMTINAIGTGSTLQITGLPFTPIGAVPFGGSVTYWASLSGTFVFVGCYTVGAAIQFTTATGATATAGIGTAIFQNGSDVIFTIVYFAS